MWAYEKALAYPVALMQVDDRITVKLQAPLEKLADFTLLTLALRYGAQKDNTKAILTDIFTECLNLMEVLCALIYQSAETKAQDVSLDDAHIYCSAMCAQTSLHLLMLSVLSLSHAYDDALKGLAGTEAEPAVRFLRARAGVHYERLQETSLLQKSSANE